LYRCASFRQPSQEPDPIFKRPTVQVSPDWTRITILADQQPVADETAAVLAETMPKNP